MKLVMAGKKSNFLIYSIVPHALLSSFKWRGGNCGEVTGVVTDF
jgi:hypothetical protein